MTEAARRVFRTSKDWPSFNAQLSTLSDMEKGTAFEEVTKHFLRTSPAYAKTLKHVWLLDEVPNNVRRKLNLPNRDQGIDIVAETNEGAYWAIQCKYRSDTKASLTFREVSTFVALAFGRCSNISYGLICVTGERYTNVLKGQNRVGFCTNDIWANLDGDFFASLNSRVSKTPKQVRPLALRPHQKTAVKHIVDYFSSPINLRGKLVMPCGTGKSVISCWVASELKAKDILVLVPSLSLLKQTREVWLRNYDAENNNALPSICVCSDETVGEKLEDETVTMRSDLGVPCTTDVGAIVEWLENTKDAESRIVFATYQSGKTISSASNRARVQFDLGVFDEAHKTTGRSDALFSYLLHEQNIQIKKRLFMTATERRYEGGKNSIASMDDVNLYGETAHYLSFKDALQDRQRIISDYKILTLFVSRAEIADIISRNKFVRPVRTTQSKWDDEVEASMLACLVALRKAMRQYNIKHTISYHASIARAKAFQLNSDIFTVNYPSYGELESFHVTGIDSVGERHRTLRDFSHAKAGLVTNARCLTEGIDIPEIDCVLFADPRRSKVDIVQALGRALRPSANKEFGYILIPVVVDEGMTLEDIWETDAFKEMLFTIRTLATNDERVVEHFKGIASGRARTAHGNFIEHYASDALIAQDLNFDEFIESVNLFCWDSLAKLAYRSYSNAKSFVHKLRLENSEIWQMYCEGKLHGLELKPSNIPEDPELVYKDAWEGWQKWLGDKPMRRYVKFQSAREYVHQLGLLSTKDWRTYCDGRHKDLGYRPWFIPANPQLIYFEEWKGWRDWLGLEDRADMKPARKIPENVGNYLAFEIAREFVRSWNFKDKETWFEFMRFTPSGLNFIKQKIPVDPSEVYVDDWHGWADWLHGPGFLPFEAAREFARNLKFKSKHDWDEYRRGLMLDIPSKPQNIPFSPGVAYKTQWRGWCDWLYALEDEPIPFNVARAYVRARRLKDFQEWVKYRDGGLKGAEPLPEVVPRFPDLVYADEWVDWDDWLGRDFLPFEQARAYVRNLKITSLGAWSAWTHGKLRGYSGRPANIPVHPYRVYRSDWRSWSDWLGASIIKDASLSVSRPEAKKAKPSFNEVIMQKYMRKNTEGD